MTTINTFARPENLVVRQEAVEEPSFHFDIVHPGDDEMRNEIDDVYDELFVQDVYGLIDGTKAGDVWVDAGSHVGMFSIAAMLSGAEVAGIIDMDGELAWCAWKNASAVRLQLQHRNVLPEQGIVPQVAAEEVRDAGFLVEAAMLVPKDWATKERSCLKLDIQGSEMAVLSDGGAAKLAEAFDVIVMEWHHDEDFSELLEAGGWKVDRVAAHVDVLMNRPTRIVWASVG